MTLVTIAEGTNVCIDADLHIAAGNFWDEAGGLTGGLFVRIRDAKGTRSEPHRVAPGAEVTAGPLKFRVETVIRSRGKGVITLRPL